MQRSALVHRSLLDFPAHAKDVRAPSVVHVGRRQIVQTFVIALVVVILDEAADRRFQLTGQVIVFQQDLVLHRSVPALDLALGHRVVRLAPSVRHGSSLQPRRKLRRHVRGAVVAQ